MTDDYRHIHEGAAIGSVQPRAQLGVAGPDRASFLQGFLTNDVEALEPGSGCYAAWLTPQGRMLTDMHVLQSGGMMLLDLPGSTAEASLARLDQFHFSENVTLSSLGESLTSVWLHGPLGGTVLERVLEGATGLSTWHDYQHLPVAFGDHAVVVARIDQLGVPGFCAFLPPAQEAAFRLALVSAGAVAASPDALEATRIDVGYPLFGLDMDEETIPLEAGIEGRAISMTKGCYVGQEVIVRVLHRGHGRVAKKLVRLAIDGPAPQSGAPLVSGDREVGRLTSVGVSPAEGVVALGYVRRDALESDAALTVNGTPVRQRR